jgi:hypothetical protein
MEFSLQRGQIKIEPRLKAEYGKEVASWRRLNLAAMRTEECGIVVPDGAGPTGNRNRGIEDFQHRFDPSRPGETGQEEQARKNRLGKR